MVLLVLSQNIHVHIGEHCYIMLAFSLVKIDVNLS